MDLSEIENREEKFSLIAFEAYVFFSWFLSFKGVEGLILNLSRFSKVIDERTKHLFIGLKVKVEGESIERYHSFPCARMTSSDINVEL